MKRKNKTKIAVDWQPGDILIRSGKPGLQRRVVRIRKNTCTWQSMGSESAITLTTWIEDMIAVGWGIEETMRDENND